MERKGKEVASNENGQEEKESFKRKSGRRLETNRRVKKILRHEDNMRKARGCPRCPPHAGENAGRGSPSKHGARKKRVKWKD